jgi:hypothetical protein
LTYDIRLTDLSFGILPAQHPTFDFDFSTPLANTVSGKFILHPGDEYCYDFGFRVTPTLWTAAQGGAEIFDPNNDFPGLPPGDGDGWKPEDNWHFEHETPVPEPSGLALAALGVVVWRGFVRMRRNCFK